MIFVTGDTHGEIDVHKLSKRNFDYSKMSRDDYIIICGDFGFIWYGTKKDNWWLKWLENLPCTILWCDGNHENFNAINEYPVEMWNGGKVHKIRDNIIHLMRGEIYTINNKKFFVFGGASSHDRFLRKENISWWAAELPTMAECDYALNNLDNNNWNVDYVITHCAPDNIQYRINPSYEHDILTNLLFVIDKQLSFKHWYFGHYHIDIKIDDKHTAIYNEIIRIE